MMKFDISMESDINNLVAKSIYQNEYMVGERLSLEAAADEICGLISEGEEIANETFMETFRKIKAFIIAIFRKIINVIKMWWKKRAIKRLGKTLRNKLAPLTMPAQMLWLMSVIVRTQIKSGVIAVTGQNNFSNSALCLILLICSSGDFYIRMSMFKRMIKDTSVSDMDVTLRGFRQWLNQFPEILKFIRRGGIFGKDNFLGGDGVSDLCTVVSKQLGINQQLADLKDWSTNIINISQAATQAGIANAVKLDPVAIKNGDSVLLVLAKHFSNILTNLNAAKIFPKNTFTVGVNMSILNLFSEYNKLNSKKKAEVDKIMTSVIGDAKPLTKGDAAMIEKSLTEMVDFYNLFTLKALHFMDRLEADEKESLRPIVTVSKEMLHQIFAIINYCNYIVSDIDSSKYDIDLASDNSVVDDILNNEDDINLESLEVEDSYDEDIDLDFELD